MNGCEPFIGLGPGFELSSFNKSLYLGVAFGRSDVKGRGSGLRVRHVAEELCVQPLTSVLQPETGGRLRSSPDMSQQLRAKALD